MTIGIDASRAFIKDRTGTENYAYQLIKALAKIDRSNHYILYIKASQYIDFNLPSNFEVKEIRLPRLWTQLGLATRTFLDPLDWLFIPAHTLPIIRRPKLKTLVTIHGLEYEYLPEYYQFPQKLLLNRSTEYAVKQADRLIAVSEWTKKELVGRLGANPEKVKVIYEGVDQNKFKVQSAKFKIEQTKKKYSIVGEYILFVGTIQPRKNLARLIEAFSQLVPDFNNLNLVLVGKRGWLYDKIVRTPERLGIEKKVCFLGHVPDRDLITLYQGAKLFCLPSLMEGFGLPILEAMAAGVPVVAANTGALPEIVGQAGLLVNPQKTEAISQACRLILKNPKLGEGLKELGLKRVKLFSWEKTAQKTLDIFRDLE